MKDNLKLYKKYYINNHNESKHLFQILESKYNMKSGLYPGSFIHITPSFFIPRMTYLDSDKRCNSFFSDENVRNLVTKEKLYKENPEIEFIEKDFTKITDVKIKKVDVLFSFYAGFISKYCKQFLKKDGILVANNSHGDATIAFLDKTFKLIAVIKRNGDKFRLIEQELDKYFIQKNGKPIDEEKVLKTMTGPGYTNPAYAYVFKKKT